MIDPSLPAVNVNFTVSEATAGCYGEPVPPRKEDGGGWLCKVKLE